MDADPGLAHLETRIRELEAECRTKDGEVRDAARILRLREARIAELEVRIRQLETRPAGQRSRWLRD